MLLALFFQLLELLLWVKIRKNLAYFLLEFLCQGREGFWFNGLGKLYLWCLFQRLGSVHFWYWYSFSPVHVLLFNAWRDELIFWSFLNIILHLLFFILIVVRQFLLLQLEDILLRASPHIFHMGLVHLCLRLSALFRLLYVNPQVLLNLHWLLRQLYPLLSVVLSVENALDLGNSPVVQFEPVGSSILSVLDIDDFSGLIIE